MIKGTFLLIGDSLIAGFDWQSRMPSFKVYNYGVPGENIQGLLNRLPVIEKAVESPDIILIMSGINNVIAEDYVFIDILRKIVIRLSNAYPNAEIILNSLPHIKISLLVDDAIRHLNGYIETVSRESGCCYLDNFVKHSERNPDIFLSDGIHLNDETYELWARAFLEYVAFLLEEDENENKYFSGPDQD
jgi:lysophospholipase L1-like esterase